MDRQLVRRIFYSTIRLLLDNAFLGLFIGCRRQLAFAAQPGPEDEEDHRNWNHHSRNAAEKRPSPLNPHILKHLPCKEREDRSHG